MREAIKEERLLTEIEDRGTDRDRLILEWFDYVTTPNGESKPDPFRLRLLSLEKFQQLRSKIDPLSDEQIGEEIEKQKEYLLRKEKTRLRARRYRQRLKEQDRLLETLTRNKDMWRR